MRELEPLSFDRALREAARELERRRAQGDTTGAALPPQLTDEETLHWVRELRAKDPVAPALEAWLLRLREQAFFEAQRRELGVLRRAHPHPIVEPEQARLPLAEMFQRSLARPRERAAYLRSYFACSTELADRVRRLWEERQIYAEQLKAPLESFEEASSATRQSARALLGETEGAFETLQVHDPAALVSTLLAESASEGWPARLSPRSTLDLLADRAWVHGLRLRPFKLPQAYAASSFVLALAEAGRAISDAASAQRSPFVLSSDVFDLRRDTLGALLASLPLSAAFATRRLGLSPSRAREQQRSLARAALSELRVAAFRVLLRQLLLGSARHLQSELPELSHVALGFELPVTVAGVFIRVRPRDSQRFSAALLAATRHEQLVQAHDDDWFRNPRAVAELRAELGEPLFDLPSAEALAAGAQVLARRLESLL